MFTSRQVKSKNSSGRMFRAEPKPSKRQSAKKKIKKSDKKPRRLAAASSRRSTRRGFDRKPFDRRRLKVVLFLTIVSTLAVVVIGYINSSAFTVTTVEVVGAERVEPSEVQEISAITPGLNLLDVDPSKAETRINEVPWVQNADVDRSWSGSVVIAVTERQPAAAIKTSSGFMLIDASGRQLEEVSEAPDSYLPISGLEISGQVGEEIPSEGVEAIGLQNLLSVVVKPLVTEVELNGGRLVAYLDADKIEQDFAQANSVILVNFGDSQELEQKMVSLETVLSKVDLTCVEKIDISVPSSPTVLRSSHQDDSNELSEGSGGC